VALARRARGPVLELGCGNGRITVPIARAGRGVVGVDLSRPMLADLRERLAKEPPDVRARVELRRADMRSVRLNRRFALVICPFNAFLHLYTRADVERCLARVRDHMAPRARFVLDVSVPEPAELVRSPHKLYRTRPFVYPGTGLVRYGERFDYDKMSQVLHVSMEFEPADGEPFTTPLAHRQFYPQELEALLHYNGFAVDEIVGDWAGRPGQGTETLVYACKKR
jgi:SAM-dependent methyltransferase